MIRVASAVIATVLTLLPAGEAAAATCSGANEYTFSFASRPTTQLAYGSSYSYTATRAAGGSVNVSISLAAANLSSSTVGGETLPRITTLMSGGTTRHLAIGGTFNGRTPSITGNSRVLTVTFSFAAPVVSFSLTADDIDYGANQFRDWVEITGSNGTGTFTPSMTTPWGNNNAGTSTASGSSIGFGVRTAAPALTSAAQMVGLGASDIGASTGRFTAEFTQPVTSVTLKYGNYPGENGTGQQAMGISNLAFCEMPDVALTKTSAPLNGPLGAYNIPGNDIIYTLTVTNTTGTSIDAGSIILTDVLPANVVFRNAAFDGSTSLPVKISAGSGLTLSAGSLSYRQNGSSAFSYAPSNGYDAQVAELRIIPAGELLANSTASFQFRAQVK